MANLYQIENLLQCSICLNRFQIPKVLECQHTFCFTCLQNIYDSENQILICPICQRTIKLTEGTDELPDNILLISLMKIQPIKGKCSSCQKIDTLTICEYCQCTKCIDCNEKHVNDMKKLLEIKLNELEKTNQNEFKVPVHNYFKIKRNEINNQFQLIRQEHHSNLYQKQMHILEQLELQEQSFIKQIENDFQLLEQMKCDTINRNIDINSKTESELLNVLRKASDIQKCLTEKLTQYYLYSCEIILQYDEDQTNAINHLCDSLQLNISDGNCVSSEFINITLRTFLNQEYQYRISLDKTIYELKEIFSKQENLDPKKILLTKFDNYIDELEDNRTLKSYEFNSTSILMVCLRK
ncbi:unnamed protein product [Adineta steineri]|uniref:RING-type domain-containing protein n=1 Tax=Adineta steineri TaxID=433720 RepID=A0A814UMF0_9BILA|nr:unnamed protein product [Adineta steineri]CAF1291528.1 unnamed protein product [Adineta steineri]